MSVTESSQGHLHSAGYPEVHLRYFYLGSSVVQPFNCMKSSFYPDGVWARVAVGPDDDGGAVWNTNARFFQLWSG